MESTEETAPNEESEMLLRTTEIQNLFKDYGESKRVKKHPRFWGIGYSYDQISFLIFIYLICIIYQGPQTPALPL